ncbi:hypothetical protein GCM10010174_33660 [Kutzneria viridogrisea]|uniref:Ribonuclease VapC n=2 Tax=Kutzneria TaxID=43356 RepID=W5WMW1_9PSEU|nr:type II toxin-antitoxin system VapC family toxin [Kutzneria albida]AHI02111.1 hypothetical protein KALB_8754 [Kutzneria albida DSM 43870]MBA8929328.1 hypothetical protein [Kutzneria viridogrisea]
MICYFDTSALVPLLTREPGTPTATILWEVADRVLSSELSYVEAAAALAQARRLGRLDAQAHAGALASLDLLHNALELVEVSEMVVRRAGVLAHELALRSYDAVHCASAEQLDVPDLVVASGDQLLLKACAELGMATADTSQR